MWVALKCINVGVHVFFGNHATTSTSGVARLAPNPLPLSFLPSLSNCCRVVE